MNGHDLSNAIVSQIIALMALAAIAGVALGTGIALAIWYLS